MKTIMTKKQIQAYMAVSGEFQGLSTADAASKLDITVQAFNQLMKRAEQACPQVFPILTKQEADVSKLLDLGYSRFDIANQLEVDLSRVSQILFSLHVKGRGVTSSKPIKILQYAPYMDSEIKEKF